jgi:hypothetical protein
MRYEIKAVTPVYGVNYAAGWSFASFRENNKLSHGIAWFTRWDQMSQLPVSHVGFVAGPNSVIEATREKGVVETPIGNYFDDPHVHIYFRKPRGWTPDLGKRIAAMAMIQIGDSYDTALIKAHLAAGTFLGHWISKFSDDALELWLCNKFNDPDAWICSELCAWTMQQFEAFDRKGVLAHMPCTVTPPEYIWDQYLFKPLEQE